LPNIVDILAGMSGDDTLARTATIQELNLDGTVDLNYMGFTALNVPVVSTYTPSSGDVVQVMRRGPGSLIVIGSVRTANVISGSVTSDFVVSYNIDAVPTTITGGGTAGSSGTLTVFPQSAGSYRRADGWSRSDVRQGVYYTSTSLGYYHGGWFYGSNAFSQLKGRTITSVKIYLERQQAGNYADQDIYIYGHKNATKPSGDIYFTGTRQGTIATPWPSQGANPLPISVGQNLASGNYKGLGLLYNGTAHYVVISSIAQYANSGRLDIGWRED